MDFNCYYKVHGMAALRETFEPFTERFLIYQLAIEKMAPFLGKDYIDNTSLFFNRVKQAVEIFKREIMAAPKGANRKNSGNA